ncbi:RNA recognition motif domain [Dillenia turbinata]|uniref:RNA recognition motif domain n=1 Tax=Dillenia turbinata TaxID=194707 RepID=A0AAN8VBB6_9MAGN
MDQPSKVIHVRNVGHEISENDLLQPFQPFGVITKLVMLRAKHQALLQMQDIASAINASQFYANVQPSIRKPRGEIPFNGADFDLKDEIAKDRKENLGVVTFSMKKNQTKMQRKRTESRVSDREPDRIRLLD